MRNSRFVLLTVAVASLGCVLSTFTSLAQTQRPTDQQTGDRVVITKDEVALDLVVRDKRGKVVKDLTLADFEVYEDGVKQDVSSFRFAASTAKENTSTPTTTNGGNDTTGSNTLKVPKTPDGPGVSAVALVFDRLSPEARVRARDAALSYVGESVMKTELVGVFITDLSVVVKQPFTFDTPQIKSAIESVALHAPSLYSSTNAEARAARQAIVHNKIKSSAGNELPIDSTESPTSLAHMLLTRVEYLEEIQRVQQGNATAHGLLHIAASLRSVPGRKAIIFFSEGLVLPTSVMEGFRSVINEANRSNVSFYTVDAAGLRASSKEAETRKEINSRSDVRMTQLGTTEDKGGPMTKDMERNEDLLRLNPENGLRLLANQTGGFLITDSNDVKDRLQKVDEDLHSYYLLSYTSNNQKYDGHFRKIEVKLKRSGVSVQTRSGYYAIKGTYESPLLSYEVPAIAALGSAPKSDSFPFYAGGFSFPGRDRIGLAPIMVDVPISPFTLRIDQAKKTYETDFSIVTLVKDKAGQVVAKLSNQYQLNGPGDKVEEAKKGRVLFYREPNLSAGTYTLETIAYDAPSGRFSVRTGTLEVPETDASKLRLSDVLLLKRAEPVSASDENQSNPFRVGNMIVSPNLGEPIQRSLKQVPFFFTVYVPTASKPKLTIELISQGRTLVQLPGELPETDAMGRSQFVGALPLEKLPAGTYELKITVTGDAGSMLRSRNFTLVD